MNGVAIDWITKNIYWTDGLYKIIGVKSSVVTVTVHSWKAIVDSNLTSPQDIVVNPLLRYVSLCVSKGAATLHRGTLNRRDN